LKKKLRQRKKWKDMKLTLVKTRKRVIKKRAVEMLLRRKKRKRRRTRKKK